MSKRFYADETRVVIYEEAPGGGDPIDPNSLMNRPIISPMSWLPNVFFHSDFDYYNTFIATTVSLSHPSRAAGSSNPTPNVARNSLLYVSDYALLTHGLGYVPKFYAAIGGKMMPNTYPIQIDGTGAFRYVCVYATATQIRVYETAQTSNVQSLSAATFNYQILIFAESNVDPSMDLLEIEPGAVNFGQGKFRDDRPPMRIAAVGETPFAQAETRTTAIRNGSTRSYLPNSGYVDAGPFNGSLPAPSFVNVQSGLF